jgi:hypothetical protein
MECAPGGGQIGRFKFRRCWAFLSAALPLHEDVEHVPVLADRAPHGLFTDGSCWSEVIARLQTGGLNVTSVQNPLTTLPEAATSAKRALAQQDGVTPAD